jgi:hypothetical protein
VTSYEAAALILTAVVMSAFAMLVFLGAKRGKLMASRSNVIRRGKGGRMSGCLVYKCNLCSSPRKEANHWWVMFQGREASLILMTWDDAVKMGILGDPGVLHICGAECASKALSSWMGKPQPLAARASA